MGAVSDIRAFRNKKNEALITAKVTGTFTMDQAEEFLRDWEAAIEKAKALPQFEIPEFNEEDAVLCYIDKYSHNEAVFTTLPLKLQWGDDWNDAPYEHNCGFPYEWNPRDDKPPYKLYWVRFSVDMETPAQRAWGGNSLYSVEMINNRETAWLASEGKEPIYAGISIAEFKRLIKLNGGTIWVEEK